MSGFRALAHAEWRALGLMGRYLTATPAAGGIAVAGEAGGRLAIAAGEVARLRIGYSEDRRRHYTARIWRQGAAAPLRLAAAEAHPPGYAATIRPFAAAVAAAGGTVERGTTKAEALMMPVLMGLLAVVAIGIALMLTEEPWWGRLIVPAAPSALTALTAWLAATRHWPRPVADPAELDRQLPR